jgi:hypothetical protein
MPLAPRTCRKARRDFGPIDSVTPQPGSLVVSAFGERHADLSIRMDVYTIDHISRQDEFWVDERFFSREDFLDKCRALEAKI